MLRFKRRILIPREQHPPEETAAGRRLDKLAAKARVVLLIERAWRSAVPPLLVALAFVAVSWAGIWLVLPPWARGIGVTLFALGLIAALLPLRSFRFPTRKEAVSRIDRASGLASRPAEVLDDQLGNGGSDPATAALWNLHRRRAGQDAARLRAGAPSPRTAEIDRYALRATLAVALAATAFVAGPEKYARIAAAFDWHLGAFQQSGASRIDAWIDPPAYTGRPPAILNLSEGRAFSGLAAPQFIEAPIGSAVVLHAPGGDLDLEIKGPLAKAAKEPGDGASLDASRPAAPPSPAPPVARSETRLILRGDATLAIGTSSRRLGAFEIHAIPDNPPSIALLDVPKFNSRGTFVLSYSIADDYGAASARADFARPVLPGGRLSTRSLVSPPEVPLLLPGPERNGSAETTADLSEHPWAGARVEMTLTARDEAGNEGASSPLEITLPQKPFVKPLARALAEQRRNLVLAPGDKARVAAALEALMLGPEEFGTDAGAYLGLRVALGRVNAARNDEDLRDAADFLWQMALRIESGDLSEAERDLRAAEQQLREALQRGTPEDEIRKLAENLRVAMERFLQELAARQSGDSARNAPVPVEGGGRWVSPKDLQAMLEEMQRMLRSGDSADAARLLDQLQNILENLHAGRPRKADPRAQEMSQALDELGHLSQDQQDLRDDTYQRGQPERQRQREERRQFGLPRQLTLSDIFGQGPGEDAPGGEAEVKRSEQKAASPPPSRGQPGNDDLAGRQSSLRGRLTNLLNRLKGAGSGPEGLDGAEEAMREAENALRQGPPGTDPAVEAQGRAIEALREGAQKLAEAMRGGEGMGEDEPQTGQGSPGRPGSTGGTDPLGRGLNNPASRMQTSGAPAAERARRVLEEVRRRLGDIKRPRDETDYLERLLQRY